jgi:hypothetical protein
MSDNEGNVWMDSHRRSHRKKKPPVGGTMSHSRMGRPRRSAVTNATDGITKVGGVAAQLGIKSIGLVSTISNGIPAMVAQMNVFMILGAANLFDFCVYYVFLSAMIHHIESFFMISAKIDDTKRFEDDANEVSDNPEDLDISVPAIPYNSANMFNVQFPDDVVSTESAEVLGHHLTAPVGMTTVWDETPYVFPPACTRRSAAYSVSKYASKVVMVGQTSLLDASACIVAFAYLLLQGMCTVDIALSFVTWILSRTHSLVASRTSFEILHERLKGVVKQGVRKSAISSSSMRLASMLLEHGTVIMKSNAPDSEKDVVDSVCKEVYSAVRSRRGADAWMVNLMPITMSVFTNAMMVLVLVYATAADRQLPSVQRHFGEGSSIDTYYRTLIMEPIRARLSPSPIISSGCCMANRHGDHWVYLTGSRKWQCGQTSFHLHLGFQKQLLQTKQPRSAWMRW